MMPPTVIVTEPLVIYGDEDAPNVDMGVLHLTAEGVEWYLDKRLIYKDTWTGWALTMTYSGHTA